jgi:hypothetical protein
VAGSCEEGRGERGESGERGARGEKGERGGRGARRTEERSAGLISEAPVVGVMVDVVNVPVAVVALAGQNFSLIVSESADEDKKKEEEEEEEDEEEEEEEEEDIEQRGATERVEEGFLVNSPT